MMRKLRLLILPLLLLIGLIIWLLPTLLKTIPSRYLVRLPEPLQQLGLPDDQVPILPTVSSPVNADALLGTGVVQAASLPAVVAAGRGRRGRALSVWLGLALLVGSLPGLGVALVTRLGWRR